MKNLPMLRSWKAAVCFMLLAVVFCAFFSIPGGMGIVTLGMMCVMCAPFYLCLTCAVGGLIPALGALLALIVSMTLTGGVTVALLGLAYAGGVLLMYCICQKREISFMRAIVCMAITHLTLLLAIIVGLQIWAKGGLYSMAADAAIHWLGTSMSDTELFYLSQMLYMTQALPQLGADAGVVVDGFFVFEAAAKAEWLKQVCIYIERYLQAFSSGALVSCTVMSGVFSLAYPTWRGRLSYQRRSARGMLRADEAEPPDLQMPPLSKWFMPRGIGLRVGILALGYLLTMSDSSGLGMAGSILYEVFASIYGIQGACTLDFFLRKRDMRRFTRRLIVVAIYLILPNVLTIIGVYDQITNLRKLRPPTDREKRRDELVERMREERDRQNDQNRKDR